jgi:hypothetical protein
MPPMRPQFARRAVEELGAQMLLEFRDLAAGRRGRRVEAPCRGGEAAGLSDRQHQRHGFEAIHRVSFPRHGTVASSFAQFVHAVSVAIWVLLG